MASYVPQTYGSLPLQQLEAGLAAMAAAKGNFAPKEPFKPRQRTRFSCAFVCVSLFLPWFLFSALCALLTFKFHYSTGGICWAIVLLAALIPLSFVALAWLKRNEENSSAFALMFLFSTCSVAIVAGVVLGNLNYWTNMQPYYDLHSLNRYDYVNPSKNKGGQMMDAGIMTFVQGSRLDLRKAQVFQSVDNYCVAPISLEDPFIGGVKPLQTYDFWAVGLNCCGYNNSQSIEFKCGSYKSKTARQGLRLMSESQRDFFRLAVQQAAARHRITTNQPVLFYWTEDAVGDRESYWGYGSLFYWVGVGVFFAMQVFVVLVTSFAVSKLGY